MMKQKYACHRPAVEIIAEWIGIIAERIIQDGNASALLKSKAGQQCVMPGLILKVAL